jgi:hypothetical protein
MTNYRPQDAQYEAREPGPQPDPMLRSGRRGRAWIWFIGLVIVFVVAGTFYALNPPASKTAASGSARPQTSGPSKAPSTPLSGGRTTGAAPVEQPATPAR